MKPTPTGWPRITPTLYYQNTIAMVAATTGTTAGPHRVPQASPLDFNGANTQTIQVYVEDAKAHCEAARSAGALITDEPFLADHGDDYWADLSYGALDPEKNLWWFTERIRG